MYTLLVMIMSKRNSHMPSVSVLEVTQRQESKLRFRGLILPCRGGERRGRSWNKLLFRSAGGSIIQQVPRAVPGSGNRINYSRFMAPSESSAMCSRWVTENTESSYSSEDFVSVLEVIERQESKLRFSGLILPCRGDERRGRVVEQVALSFCLGYLSFSKCPVQCPALRTESIIQVPVLEVIERQESKLRFRGLILPCQGARAKRGSWNKLLFRSVDGSIIQQVPVQCPALRNQLFKVNRSWRERSGETYKGVFSFQLSYSVSRFSFFSGGVRMGGWGWGCTPPPKVVLMCRREGV
ncbi:hypothetical protein CEXT_419901 [Caerostris extrusa]|uniref:Uncharacterized protein n=1 Tax=Caerostris extrusa TaxID=172846 RepID=A0AAV4SKP5_CAEEX|nr:hypothetical protein CEXT_419901 [Caerostris extrusa]